MMNFLSIQALAAKRHSPAALQAPGRDTGRALHFDRDTGDHFTAAEMQATASLAASEARAATLL